MGPRLVDRRDPHSGTTFELLGSTGVALVVMAVCLVVADALPLTVFPLAAVGSMALTVYAVSIVTAGALGSLDYADNWPWLVYIAVTMALATAWRLLLGRGPRERLLTWSSTRAAGMTRPYRSSA